MCAKSDVDVLYSDVIWTEFSENVERYEFICARDITSIVQPD